ncbi:hypothetical protein E2320_013970 [Naja naja]|nr:hypothetical protein E2320_013970 [Naja naja]
MISQGLFPGMWQEKSCRVQGKYNNNNNNNFLEFLVTSFALICCKKNGIRGSFLFRICLCPASGRDSHPAPLSGNPFPPPSPLDFYLLFYFYFGEGGDLPGLRYIVPAASLIQGLAYRRNNTLCPFQHPSSRSSLLLLSSPPDLGAGGFLPEQGGLLIQFPLALILRGVGQRNTFKWHIYIRCHFSVPGVSPGGGVGADGEEIKPPFWGRTIANASCFKFCFSTFALWQKK